MLNLRADALLDLAAVLPDGGQAQAAAAAELYRRKGNLAAAGRVAATGR